MSVPDAPRGGVARGADDPSRAGSTQQQRLEVEQWNFQSPILPPAILEQYNQIIPNFAERYFDGWERQTTHRQRLESVAVATQSKMQLRGQVLAAGIGALTLVVAGALGITDHQTAAVAVVGIDFASLGGAFFYSRYSDRKELERNAQAVPDPSVPPPSRPELNRGQRQPPRSNNRKKKGKR